MNDTEIRDFFRGNMPVTSDEGTFLAGLSAKMDAVSEIKAIQETSIRKSRRIAGIALVAGILIGCVITAFILIKPISAPQLRQELLASFGGFIAEWKYFLMAAVAIGSVIMGVFPWKEVK